MKTSMKTSIFALATLFLLPSVQAATAFETTQALQGITFKVTSPNAPTANSVTITPGGLKNDNSPITVEAGGIVTGVEVGDINADGSPEIYIYIAEPTGDKRANLIAFSANRKKSLSPIYLPALEDDAKNAKGCLLYTSRCV